MEGEGSGTRSNIIKIENDTEADDSDFVPIPPCSVRLDKLKPTVIASKLRDCSVRLGTMEPEAQEMTSDLERLYRAEEALTNLLRTLDITDEVIVEGLTAPMEALNLSDIPSTSTSKPNNTTIQRKRNHFNATKQPKLKTETTKTPKALKKSPLKLKNFEPTLKSPLDKRSSRSKPSSRKPKEIKGSKPKPTASLKTKSKPKYKCTICPKTFTTQSYMFKHVRIIHEGQERFKCNVCHTTISRKDNFNVHMKLHSGIGRPSKMSTCDICLKQFTSKSYLKSHIQMIHEGRERYECYFCGKIIVRKDNFHTHMKLFHFHEVRCTFACKGCGKTFSRQDRLNRHFQTNGCDALQFGIEQ